ncbi:hypothetical protein HZF24_13345 [Sedimentibacter hydroxybenzoicus DSM 7310]|uniref:Uncharacterized protein n=1 Tax=Sedimentibacter hydroxybenzoicus DSM 7310 TaxID=1123245 RepID=A0A974GX43_SEDHY|nr:hypothetical protein [Sedimentibacter hydroxybenzoicus]NYB75128.1 hypothetical protein [Sedimentibacter hydroxybenzoicus DSM 7310]
MSYEFNITGDSENGNEAEPISLDEAEEVKDIVALIGNFVRDKSSEGQLVNGEELLEEPLSVEVEDIIPTIEELRLREDFSDIIMYKGKEKIYLYSEKFITPNYANIMITAEEKDFFKMIVDTVRQESRIYPRPTSVNLFRKAPFNMSKDEFFKVYNQLKRKEEYEDIKEVKASNDAIYLYSDEFMKKAHARSIAEWIEVESEQNP